MLRDALGLPVDLQDERLSTVEAERALAASGVRGHARRRVVDRSAATVILQAYLDRSG
jgi:putative Holliday junction resolvase